VAVQQHAIVVAPAVRGRHLDEDQRGAPFQPHHLQGHAGDVLRARPGFHQRDRAIHVAVRHPVGIEHRRLVGDADVLDQLRDDFGVPLGVDELLGLVGIHGIGSCEKRRPF